MPNIRVESDAVKRRTVSCCLRAGAAHAGRYVHRLEVDGVRSVMVGVGKEYG